MDNNGGASSVPLVTAHARCATPVFAQSRCLQHVVASEWRDALFALLETRPIDAIYSIAFALSFAPTFNLRADSRGGARAEASARASRELYDLLDDHMSGFCRDDSRVDPLTTFVAANETYVTRVKEHETFLEKYLPVTPGENPPPPVSDEDRTLVASLFRELNDVGAPLPFLLNANGSGSTSRFDVEAISRMKDLHSPLPNNTAVATAATANWSPVQLYVRYAYALHRHRSLADIARGVERARGIEILPILFPTGCAWQAGTSQLLWVLVHTLCALSVARENACLGRVLHLLSNLNFFVWCGECKYHWSSNGGEEYFAAYARRISELRDHLPIDIVVARCHNAIAANSRYGRGLSAWTLSQIVIDYREFVDRLLLRRRPRVCNRYECPGGGGGGETSFFMRPFYVETDACGLSADDALRLGRGEWLLDRLWRTVDPRRRIKLLTAR